MPEKATMLSRSGRSDPAGKLSARLDIPVTEEMNDAVAAMAFIAKKPKAEFLREALEELFFGRFTMMQKCAEPLARRPWDQSPTNSGE